MKRISLTTQTVTLGIGRMLNMAASALTMMVLARIMPDHASYGAVWQLLMLNVVFSQVFALGLPQAIYYFLPRYQGGEQKGFLAQIVLMLMGSGALLALGLYAGADGLGRFLGSDQLPGMLRVFAPYPVFILPMLVLEGTLLHFQRPLAIVSFNLVLRVGVFCALVIPTLLRLPLSVAVGIWVGLGGLMCAVALLLIFTGVRALPLIWRPAMLRETWVFALPMLLVTLVNTGVGYVDRIIVANRFGSAAYGVYANATIEIPTVTMITNATVIVLTAEFARRASLGDYAGILPIWHRATIKTALLIFPSFGFLAFWAQETMVLLFSERYAESGGLFGIAVWLIPLALFAMRPLYVAHGAMFVLAGLTLIELLFGVPCMLLFGHWFGLKGVVVGMVLSGYLGIIPWVHWYVRRLTQIGWRAFMPWRTIAAALLIALMAGAASRALHLWPGDRWPLPATYVTAGVVFLALYFTGLFLTGLLGHLAPGAARWSLLRRAEKVGQ